MKNKKRDLLVEITFLPTEHGGRKSQIVSGYRPQFYYNGMDWMAGFDFLNDDKPINPGDTVRAYVTFGSPKDHYGRIKNNNHFLLREGQRVLAYGHVIKLIDLKINAK
jgi:translation elongation factor EF-Tu-like GTPase